MHVRGTNYLVIKKETNVNSKETLQIPLEMP